MCLYGGVDLLRCFHDETKVRTPFIYHALHKTASETTRCPLRKLCEDKQLKCLSYVYCNETNKLIGLFDNCPVERFNSFVECSKNHCLNYGAECEVDFGTFTKYRLESGCCRKFNTVNKTNQGKFDGIIDHFSLKNKMTFKFLLQASDSIVRFTILRNPLNQFISYFFFIQNTHYYKDAFKNFSLPLVNIEVFVSEMYKFHQYGTSTNRNMNTLYNIVANSQSKELGWDGHSDIVKFSLKTLKQIDFVGFYHKLDKAYVEIAKLLNVSPCRFFPIKKRNRSKKRKLLDNHILNKIRKLQYADIALYENALNHY